MTKTWTVGQEVFCNGNPNGKIVEVCTGDLEGMVVVRLYRSDKSTVIGEVCVDAQDVDLKAKSRTGGMSLRDELIDTFKQHIPKYESHYSNQVRYIFNRISKDLPGAVPDSISHRIYSNGRLCVEFSSALKQNVTDVKAPDAKPWDHFDYALDEEKLKKNAAEYALAVIVQFADKLAQKLGPVSDIQVVNHDYTDITVKGTISGSNVTIYQQTVLKVSSRGVLFNQFPALIYVDGKKVPEKDYKTRFGIK